MQNRDFLDEGDFWKIRQFLINTYMITPLGLNWDVRRWDGVMFYKAKPGIAEAIAQSIQLWEGWNGDLKGVVHSESEGEVHLFVHPDFRELDGAMLDWVEQQMQERGRDRIIEIVTFAYDYDSRRKIVLKERGYQRTDYTQVIRRLRLDRRDNVRGRLPGGYRMMTTRKGDIEMGGAIATLLNAAFNRDFHTAEEHAGFSQNAPCYVEDMDLVIMTMAGEVAAYVGVAYDEHNLVGIFEPVCTHPEHQKKGLAKFLMSQGLRRLQALGGREGIVSTGSAEAANRLYDSIGFNEKEVGRYWKKERKQ
jgi:GNAT superfamily N-acetyltransferase